MGVSSIFSPIFFYVLTLMEISIIPKWLIRYVSLDSKRQYEANILISNILIIGLFCFFKDTLLNIADRLPHFCLFEKITGIDCPVCGTTRAFCELSKGNITQAYEFNMSSLFIAIFFFFQIPLRICSLSKPQTQKTVTNISRILSWIVIFIIIINWLTKSVIHLTVI